MARAGSLALPDSSRLALMVDARNSVSNLRGMAKKKWLADYGFYESADYTSHPTRRFGGRKYDLVRCWMAHHQGMSLTSLCNVLHNEAFRRWFHAEPMVQASELILQERPFASLPDDGFTAAASVVLHPQCDQGFGGQSEFIGVASFRHENLSGGPDAGCAIAPCTVGLWTLVSVASPAKYKFPVQAAPGAVVTLPLRPEPKDTARAIIVVWAKSSSESALGPAVYQVTMGERVGRGVYQVGKT